jgi:hypothetical protein
MMPSRMHVAPLFCIIPGRPGAAGLPIPAQRRTPPPQTGGIVTPEVPLLAVGETANLPDGHTVTVERVEWLPPEATAFDPEVGGVQYPEGTHLFAAYVKQCAGQSQITASPHVFQWVLNTNTTAGWALGEHPGQSFIMRPIAPPADCNEGWITWVVDKGTAPIQVTYSDFVGTEHVLVRWMLQ